MTTKYELVEVRTENDLAHWDSIVDDSPQGTLFHKQGFLKGLTQKNRCFYIRKGDQIKAGFILQVTNSDPRHSIFHDLIIYNGFFLKKDFVDSTELSRIHSAQFEIFEFAVQELAKLFSSLCLRLPPQVTDIRPLLWLHYHEPEKKKFLTQIRYTSLLDIASINETQELPANRSFKALSSSRRQEIRYAIRDQAVFSTSQDVEQFLKVYVEMAHRYDPEVEITVTEMRVLIQSLLSQNLCRIYFCTNSSGEMEATALFAWDKKRAYYLYGATSKSARNSFSGSYVLWRAFQDLQIRGLKEVDLEGINSPQRGWFKVSFGGTINPYFQLSL